MDVIALTVFLSLLLVGLFVVLYYVERSRVGSGNAEREALKPLEEEKFRPAGTPEKRERARAQETRTR